MAVYFHHFDAFGLSAEPKIASILFEGFIGVTFFFILSGFVVAYAYEEPVINGTITKGRFLLQRIARLWPLHIISMVFAAIVYHGELISLSAIPTFFMFQSFIPNVRYAFSYNGASWCLANQLFFYFLFTRIAHLDNKKLRTLFLVGIGIVSFYGYWIGIDSELSNWLFYINPFFRSVDFIAGMLIFRISKNERMKKLMEDRNTATLMEVLSVIILAVCVIIGVRQKVSLLWRWDLFYLFPFCLLLLVFQYGNGILTRILSFKLFVKLGDCSFAFFLFHQIILVIIARYCVITDYKTAFIYGCMALPFIWGGCMLITKFVEKPLAKGVVSICVKIKKSVS